MKIKQGSIFLQSIIASVVVTLCILTAGELRAEEQGWPLEIDSANATIVVFQPQLETFEGNRLTGRTAVSVTKKGKTEPVGVYEVLDPSDSVIVKESVPHHERERLLISKRDKLLGWEKE